MSKLFKLPLCTLFLLILSQAFPALAVSASCGHPGTTQTILQQATCTSEGELAIECPYCGTLTQMIPMTPHQMGSWTTVRQPTDQEEGLEEAACVNCGAVETRVLPKRPSKEPEPPAESGEKEELPPEPVSHDGWRELKDGRRYYISGSKYATGWYAIKEQLYCFDPKGYLITGWYRDPETTAWHHFQPNGRMTAGWLRDRGQWYYLAASGRMQTGWLELPAGCWYYLTPSGAMKTGWFQDANGKWYYFTDSGMMKTGWLLDKNGSWYYFEPSGVMRTGWFQDRDGSWYCFSGLDGHMLHDAYTPDGYWIDSSGRWDPAKKLP